MEPSEEILVYAKEAARALAMGKGSLYRLARAGRIPSYSAGPRMRGVRFSISEVKAALRRPASKGRHNGKEVLVGQESETQHDR